MFHSRKLNNKINKLHERCLRIAYSDNTSSFEELFKTNNSVSVHHRNIQVLTTELYNIVNGLSPEIMKEVFQFNENTSYDTRNKLKFHSRSINSVTFGCETLSHLAPKIWELVPVEIKNEDSVASFTKTDKLSLLPIPDVRFSGWFRVIDTSKTCFTFFIFFFCIYQKITRFFFVILDS